MKILSAPEIREADAVTIKSEPIDSIDLMERASAKCFDWFREHISPESKTVHIFCGPGNNGGDGLALSRMLGAADYRVSTYALKISNSTSGDFATNYKRLTDSGKKVTDVSDAKSPFEISGNDVLVDAIFGSGLNKPVIGWVKEFIAKLNASEALSISIDIPSGLFAGFNDDNDLEGVFRADVTLSFQCPKLAFLLGGTGSFCGEWEVLDIGLNGEFIESVDTPYRTIDLDMIRSFLKSREKFSHKGNFGHALIVAGSKGKMGASVLASEACLRSGIGLLTNHCPACGYGILQVSVPEAMVSVSWGEDFIDDLPSDLEKYNVVGIGPGIGTDERTASAMSELFKKYRDPMVIDADGINILSTREKLLKSLPENSVLTPHPGEFRRLVGNWKSDREKLEKLVDFSKKWQVITVLKGAHSAVCDAEGNIYFNTSGNPGMAKGGSGDMLLGMITGLIGRGYDSLQAARAGVFIHGLAADLAAYEIGEESLIAGDIVQSIPAAFNHIYQY